MINNYISLHNHSENSILDGMFSVEKWVQKAKQLNMKALAITDHGNLSGALQLIFESKKVNIKPIVGAEFYLVDDLTTRKKTETYHITIFAKNNKGFKNIIALNNLGNKEGFYNKPRIDYKHLIKYSKDLIITNGCIVGYLSQLIMKKVSKDEINNHIKFLKDNFEDIFIEIMLFNTEEHKILNDNLLNLSSKHNIKSIITNDSHYLEKEDAYLQTIILKIKTNKKMKEKSFKFTIKELWFRSYSEIMDARDKYYSSLISNKVFLELINNTNDIEKLVQDYELDFTYKFPSININKMKDYKNFKGWIANIKSNKKIVFNI